MHARTNAHTQMHRLTDPHPHSRTGKSDASVTKPNELNGDELRPVADTTPTPRAGGGGKEGGVTHTQAQR